MIDSRADIFSYFLLAALLLSLLADAANETRLCDTLKGEDQCDENERCIQNRTDEQPYCDCLITYERVNGRCIQELTTVAVNTSIARSEPSSDSGGGSSVAAGWLIPTFLVVIGVLLYFGARRYKWLQRFRQFRQNRYGNVLVTRDDDDDDDPPISP